MKTKTDDLIWKKNTISDLPSLKLDLLTYRKSVKNIGVVEDIGFRKASCVKPRWKSWVCLRLHPTAREVHGEVRIWGHIEGFDADGWLLFFLVLVCWVCYTNFRYFLFLTWLILQILFTFCPEKQETCTSLHPYARKNSCSLGTGKHLETTYVSTVHGLLNAQ